MQEVLSSYLELGLDQSDKLLGEIGERLSAFIKDRHSEDTDISKQTEE